MTGRQPRRPRRRTAPSPSLPRPTGTETGASSEAPRERAREPRTTYRVHHINADYSYVRTDLLTVAVVTAVTLGFIVLMNLLESSIF